LSQLVGNYDADTLCDACLRLAETIEQGLLRNLVETLNKDGTGGDCTSSVCISPERMGGYGVATLSIPGLVSLMWLMECVKLFGVVFFSFPPPLLSMWETLILEQCSHRNGHSITTESPKNSNYLSVIQHMKYIKLRGVASVGCLRCCIAC